MNMINKGFDRTVIQEYQNKINATGKNFLVVDSEDNSEEYVNFYFIGMYEGKAVIYDAVIYTLRLHHTSEMYEVAEHRAAKHFPEFKRIKYEEDENGDLEILDSLEEEIGLFMAEVIMELEAEDEIKVYEHVELDSNLDFGIGLDVALNVEGIDSEVISNFVEQYNDDSLELDKTAYSFQVQDEELLKR